ncbi:MAG: hypothetical protein WC992_06985 [Acholeplasmataceae bacterium]
MKRTKTPARVHDIELPDIINCTRNGDFTQIPNRILRDPELTFKAKGLLCLLLANREGWHSYFKTIQSMTADGRDSIRGAIKELEQSRYLVRVYYRDVQSKTFKGTVWAYTDTPNSLDYNALKTVLDTYNVEIDGKQAVDWVPVDGFPVDGFPPPNNTNENNTNENDDTRVRAGESINKPSNSLMNDFNKIVPSMFETFWNTYPRKVDKGKAKTRWNQLCRKVDRPTWNQIRDAIQRQAATARWSNPRYIPYPTTWLNQERWLDDPAAMNDGDESVPIGPTAEVIITGAFKQSDVLAREFTSNCLTSALALVGQNDATTRADVARRLIAMYTYISDKQDSFTPALRAALPGPLEIVENYIHWIDMSSWIDDCSPRMFDVSSPLFGKYRRWEASRDTVSRDPITGQSVTLH